MSPSTQRVPLIVVAVAVLLLDLFLMDSLAIAWWTLVPPVLVIGFVLAGPKPELVRWRDAALILLLVVGLARAFVVPRDWPRELRWSLGTTTSSGIVLLFVAGTYGGGIGDWLRRVSLSRIGRGLRAASYYSGESFSLLLSGAGAIWILGQPSTPKWLAVLPLVMAISAFLPERWKKVSQGVQLIGCLPVPALAIGALVGAWSYGWMWLFLASLWLTDSIEKLRKPIPEERVLGGVTS